MTSPGRSSIRGERTNGLSVRDNAWATALAILSTDSVKCYGIGSSAERAEVAIDLANAEPDKRGHSSQDVRALSREDPASLLAGRDEDGR